MSIEKVRELLAKLHDEVRKTEVDAATRSSLRKLDSDIHDLLNSPTPEEVAEMIAFLASEESSGVSGEAIRVALGSVA